MEGDGLDHGGPECQLSVLDWITQALVAFRGITSSRFLTLSSAGGVAGPCVRPYGRSGYPKISVWAALKEFAVGERERTRGTWRLVSVQ